jgi:hypothetical protein
LITLIKQKALNLQGFFSFHYKPRQFAKSGWDTRHTGIHRMASPLKQHPNKQENSQRHAATTFHSRYPLNGA